MATPNTGTPRKRAPRKTSRKSRKAHGDCYEAAGNYMIEHCLHSPVEQDLTLVHGEVCGQGPLEGVTYGHAWVEDGDWVVDNSNGKSRRIPKVLYYAMGNITDLNNLHRYTWAEARVKLVTTKIWGPWDLKTRTGL
jgi:hypothetical protein